MRKAIIVDLDGTLCEVKHRLHLITGEKKEWDKFHAECVNDTVNQWCKGMVESYRSTDIKVIYMTGRPVKYQSETIDWIKKNVRDDGGILLMKPNGDFRKDFQFKEEMYLNHLRNEYEILLAADDREETIAMWRKHGIFTLHYSS
jgi:hypothetical protein